MTEVMPFLQKYDITFLRPPPIRQRELFTLLGSRSAADLDHADHAVSDVEVHRATVGERRLGAAIELKKLGYRYQAIDTSRFS